MILYIKVYCNRIDQSVEVDAVGLAWNMSFVRLKDNAVYTGYPAAIKIEVFLQMGPNSTSVWPDVSTPVGNATHFPTARLAQITHIALHPRDYMQK